MTWAPALARILATLLLTLCAQTSSALTTGWLDDDPNAIWSRPPGFYADGGDWYAILHARPDVLRVRLIGEFTDEQSAAIELARTPDRKFWWFKGTARGVRPPARGRRPLQLRAHAARTASRPARPGSGGAPGRELGPERPLAGHRQLGLSLGTIRPGRGRAGSTT